MNHLLLTQKNVFEKVHPWQEYQLVHFGVHGAIPCSHLETIRVLSWPWVIWTDELTWSKDAFDLQPTQITYYTQEQLDELTEKELGAKCLYYKPFWALQKD